MTDIASIKKSFKNKDLFTHALTHKSWVNENKGERESNERLEFLGDAVLEFVVSNELFVKFPKKEEGYLTALRASIVNTVNLAAVAKKMQVGEVLFLSKGEEEGGGRENSSLLADTMEAIIGAIFIDQGIDTAYSFIVDNLLEDVDEKASGPLKDAKSRFQEFVQSQGLPTPQYKVASESGPDHDKSFTVEAVVAGEVKGVGNGKSKSEAAQAAAEKALNNLVSDKL